jgi:hypothetical protein
MSSRLYLRNAAASQTGAPIGTATTDADAGHVGAQRLVCLTMSSAKGAGQIQRTWNYGTGGPVHYDLVGLFLSPALVAQTLEAGQRFTVAAGLKGNAAPGTPGQYYLRAFAYLWRPGVGWVATVSASDAASRAGVNGGCDIGSDEIWRVLQFDALAESIEVRDRDRIALELWCRFNLTDAAETNNYAEFWGGADDTKTDGEPVADAASYLEYSGDLIWAEEVTMNSANILVGARDLQVDGENVGALDGGATVRYEPTHIEHTVDQRMGIQRVDKIAERMTVTANLKEATLENLRIAWGQPAAALVTEGTKTTLNIGGDDAVTEHALILTGKAPGTNRTRTITCHKAVAIETSAHSYSKDGATVYPVTFVLVEDATKDEGFKYMTIEDDEGQFSFA